MTSSGVVRVCVSFVAAVIKMEGGSDHDLLSLDNSLSGENGDKSLEGDDEKRNRRKDSELKGLASTI